MAILATSFLIGSFSFLQVKRTCIKAWMILNFGQIPPLTMELSTTERLKIDIILWPLLAPSFLIGSSLFLQVMGATIKYRTSFKFGQIRSLTVELPALGCLKKTP